MWRQFSSQLGTESRDSRPHTGLCRVVLWLFRTTRWRFVVPGPCSMCGWVDVWMLVLLLYYWALAKYEVRLDRLRYNEVRGVDYFIYLFSNYQSHATLFLSPGWVCHHPSPVCVATDAAAGYDYSDWLYLLVGARLVWALTRCTTGNFNIRFDWSTHSRTHRYLTSRKYCRIIITAREVMLRKSLRSGHTSLSRNVILLWILEFPMWQIIGRHPYKSKPEICLV